MANAQHEVIDSLDFVEGSHRGHFDAVLTFEPDMEKQIRAARSVARHHLRAHLPVWPFAFLLTALWVIFLPPSMFAILFFGAPTATGLALMVRYANPDFQRKLADARADVEKERQGECYTRRVDADWARFAETDDDVRSLVIDWLLTTREDSNVLGRINAGEKMADTLDETEPVRQSVQIEIEALRSKREALATALREINELLRTEISQRNLEERRAEDAKRKYLAAEAKEKEQRKRYADIQSGEQERYMRQQHAQDWLDRDA